MRVCLPDSSSRSAVAAALSAAYGGVLKPRDGKCAVLRGNIVAFRAFRYVMGARAFLFARNGKRLVPSWYFLLREKRHDLPSR
jgi:hypothetical protein